MTDEEQLRILQRLVLKILREGRVDYAKDLVLQALAEIEGSVFDDGVVLNPVKIMPTLYAMKVFGFIKSIKE